MSEVRSRHTQFGHVTPRLFWATRVWSSLTHHSLLLYRGTSRTRKRTPLEPYRRPTHRVLGVLGGWAFSASGRRVQSITVADINT